MATPVKPKSSRRNRNRLEKLVRTTLTIHAEHTLNGVLQRVTDAAREVIGARYAALGVLAPGGTELATFVTSGVDPALRARIGAPPRGRGVLGLLITDPHPVRVADISIHPKAYGFPAHHPPMHSFLGVPIRGREGPFGNLYLTEKVGAAEFSEEDETVATMLAAQAAVAIDNARLMEDTSRLLVEVRAMHASRDRFFATINHELRNALTAVYGWADLLVRKGDDTLPRAAHEVYESAERTLGLLNDLLDLSRIDAARLTLTIRACDARALIREALTTVEPAAGKQGVTLDPGSATGEIGCHTDPQRVRQILVNLLSNAVRHSPAGETVRIELKVGDRRLRIDVVDRGEGIPAEQQEDIFHAFVQTDSRRERGTGLGLTLSRQLARLLGGDLRVESSPGAGSRFILDIPRNTHVP